MGRHIALAAEARDEAVVNRRALRRPAVNRPHLARNSTVLIMATMAVILGLVLVSVVDPYSGAVASPSFRISQGVWSMQAQTVRVSDGAAIASSRDGLETVSNINVPGAIPAAGVPDPDTAQAIGYKMVLERGWSTQEYDCLVLLWNRESHWNVYAHNVSSGAYGIPQSLPGEKMASAGADWQTNPVTQITWGLNYIAGRYGSPCAAWGHSEDTGWY